MISILIGIMIAISAAIGSYAGAIHILLEGTPDNVSIPDITAAIGTVEGVADVHDLHIWNICSGHVSLSTHITITPDFCEKQIEYSESSSAIIA